MTAPSPFAIAAAHYQALAETPTWRQLARPEQLPPDGDWRVWYVRGGRDSGKTWTASGYFAELIKEHPGEDWGVLAPTFAAARDVCIEGRKSGLIRALGGYERDGGMVRKWVRSLGQLMLTNGSTVYADGADDGAPKVQGKRLAGAWCDEIGLWQKWEMAWDESLKYAVTESPGLRIATGTPKVSQRARELIKRLTKDPTCATTVLATQDNREHIDPDVFADLMLSKDTTLGRQELFGEILEDIEGALWTMKIIEDHRIKPADMFDRDWWTATVVSLDPSDGTATSDEQGIAVVTSTLHRELFVQVSEGMRDTVTNYLRRAITLALEYDAPILMEKNHGGAYLVATLEQVMREMNVTVPYSVINANAGDGNKLTRAGPVAALYEQGKVHHVGTHVTLEDQMVSFTGKNGQKSPDRLDALVWAIRHLTGMTYAAGAGGAVAKFSLYAEEPRQAANW